MKFADCYEKAQRGTPDFPISYYYVDKESPVYVMSAHWHNEFEIIRVISGDFEVFLNNDRCTLHAGDILLVECGCLHRGEPNDCVYECIVFNINMLIKRQNDAAGKYLAPIIDSVVGLKGLLKGDDTELYDTIVRLFGEMQRKEAQFELEVYALLFKMFSLLYTHDYIVESPERPRNQQAHTVSRVLDWLEKNYAESVSLCQVAEVAGLSEKYLCRIFKEYTGKTLVDYTNELRVENACHQMVANGKRVTQAALDSGFNDLSYFSKIFKRYKGVLPHEYKKRAVQTK